MLTVVVYHYVRPIKNSAYPGMKGLDNRLFIKQLDYVITHYVCVTVADVVAAFYQDQPLPKNSVLLTFDDGYVDHYQYVFPELMKRGIQGVFFPVKQATLEHHMLDVNKIHFILASVLNKLQLVEEIDRFVRDREGEEALYQYKQKSIYHDEWDSSDICYIKKMLQFLMPASERKLLLERLFEKHVQCDEVSFAKQLYLNLAQLREMHAHGMYIGGHGVNHVHFSNLSLEQQEFEIRGSLDFLSYFYPRSKYFTFCYPYGDYNKTTLAILKKYQCALAFTVDSGMMDCDEQNALQIKRIDTNHFLKLAETQTIDG